MATVPPVMDTSNPVRNALKFGYCALRAKDRFLEGTYRSPYEEFLMKLAEAVSPQKKLEFAVSSSEVESFYTKQITEEDFVTSIQSKILSKVSPGDLSPLYSVVWDTYVSVPSHTPLCTKLPRLLGKQLWEIFNKLDVEGKMRVHIEDVCNIILRIFNANGHSETEANIQEWFCGETQIDFWSFFSALVEKYVEFLQVLS